MKKEPEEIFGSHKEYIQALIRFSHPRHKEAMEIRAERMESKKEKESRVYFCVENGELNMYRL